MSFVACGLLVVCYGCNSISLRLVLMWPTNIASDEGMRIWATNCCGTLSSRVRKGPRRHQFIFEAKRIKRDTALYGGVLDQAPGSTCRCKALLL